MEVNIALFCYAAVKTQSGSYDTAFIILILLSYATFFFKVRHSWHSEHSHTEKLYKYNYIHFFQQKIGSISSFSPQI